MENRAGRAALGREWSNLQLGKLRQGLLQLEVLEHSTFSSVLVS